jgi:hypothetical protein
VLPRLARNVSATSWYSLSVGCSTTVFTLLPSIGAQYDGMLLSHVYLVVMATLSLALTLTWSPDNCCDREDGVDSMLAPGLERFFLLADGLLLCCAVLTYVGQCPLCQCHV